MSIDSYQLMLATATAVQSTMKDDSSTIFGDDGVDTVFLLFSAFSTTVAFFGIVVGVYLVVSDTDFDFDAAWCSVDGVGGLLIMGASVHSSRPDK